MYGRDNTLTTKRIKDTSSKGLHAPNPLLGKIRTVYPATKCSGVHFGVLRLIYEKQNAKKKTNNNNSYDANYTIKINLWESSSDKADHRMSQVTQPSLFTNVLPISLRVLRRPHRVGKTLIYVSTDYYKLENSPKKACALIG